METGRKEGEIRRKYEKDNLNLFLKKNNCHLSLFATGVKVISIIVISLSVGRECLFEEVKRIKGKTDLSKHVKKMYGIEN